MGHRVLPIRLFSGETERVLDHTAKQTLAADAELSVDGRHPTSSLVGGKHIVKVPAPMSYIGSGSSVSLPARLRAQTLRRSVRR
jgi:hypothetical protein